MVLVTTLGYGVNNGPAGAMAPESITGYTKILLTEVMPAVERGLQREPQSRERAIAGLSMGGAETLYTALNNLDKFAWIGSFSGAFVMWPGANAAAARRSGACGRQRRAAARPAPGGCGRQVAGAAVGGRRRARSISRVRQELSRARRESQLEDQDAVDHLRHR